MLPKAHSFDHTEPRAGPRGKGNKVFYLPEEEGDSEIQSPNSIVPLLRENVQFLRDTQELGSRYVMERSLRPHRGLGS